MLNQILYETDDPDFIDLIDTTVSNALREYAPDEMHLIRLDNWFGDKWLGFRGKKLGALGIGTSNINESFEGKLAIPPFNPNRIVSQTHYLRTKSTKSEYTEFRELEKVIHKFQTSADNIKRYIDEVSKSALFVWFSGDTTKNTSGSLMVYVQSEKGSSGWYAGFEKNGTWKAKVIKGISDSKLKEFTET